MLNLRVSSQRLGLPLKPIDLLPNLKIALISNFRWLWAISRVVLQMDRKGLCFFLVFTNPTVSKMWASTQDAHPALKIRLDFYSVLQYTILFKGFLLGDAMQNRLASFA